MVQFLILIGEAKCGTSTMHKYLMQHPQITKMRKEENYITKTKNPTLLDYLKSLKGTVKSEIVCDVSPKYFRTVGTELKIHKIVPNAKLVLMLRNPVDRLYSNYFMNIKQDFRGTFDDYIDSSLHKNIKNPNINRYTDNLKRWYSYFDKEQILIIKSEDFFVNEFESVNNIFSFIGLPKISLTKIRPIIPYTKPNSTPSNHYPKLDTEKRRKLEEEFNNEIKSFELLTGRKFWSV
jgi:hypothetical protein